MVDRRDLRRSTIVIVFAALAACSSGGADEAADSTAVVASTDDADSSIRDAELDDGTSDADSSRRDADDGDDENADTAAADDSDDENADDENGDDENGDDENGEDAELALTPADPVTEPVALLAGALPVTMASVNDGRGLTAIDTFDGDPAQPTPWSSANWDISVHSRDDLGSVLEPMDAAHGPNCEAPPASHLVERYDEAVFQCRDHMMTAINSPSYGVLYLAPDRLVDFSEGEAVVKVDVSTLVNSTRDWWDIWISPYDSHLQLPGEDWYPDLQDAPETAVHIRMATFNETETGFVGELFINHELREIEGNYGTSYESVLTPDAKRRDTFELRISRDHVTFGMPDYNLWWVDNRIDDLGFDVGVVQFGHHSYNPRKDDVVPDARASTWHWDNVEIAPSVEFDINHADRRQVADTTTVNFDHAAGEQSHLRFSGLGNNIEFTADGGEIWVAAIAQKHRNELIPDHFVSYWTPIPAGTSSVQFRGTTGWQARDITIWSTTPEV